MIYEIMKKNSTKNEKSKGGEVQPDNITFDFEGKIIQIARPKEDQLPDDLTNPKVKVK